MNEKNKPWGEFDERTSLATAFDPKSGLFAPAFYRNSNFYPALILPEFSFQGYKIKNGDVPDYMSPACSYAFYPYGESPKAKVWVRSGEYTKKSETMLELNPSSVKETVVVDKFAEPLLLYSPNTTDEDLGDQLVNAYRLIGFSKNYDSIRIESGKAEYGRYHKLTTRMGYDEDWNWGYLDREKIYYNVDSTPPWSSLRRQIQFQEKPC